MQRAGQCSQVVEVVEEDAECGDPPEAIEKRENGGRVRRTIDDKRSVAPRHGHHTSGSESAARSVSWTMNRAIRRGFDAGFAGPSPPIGADWSTCSGNVPPRCA